MEMLFFCSAADSRQNIHSTSCVQVKRQRTLVLPALERFKATYLTQVAISTRTQEEPRCINCAPSKCTKYRSTKVVQATAAVEQNRPIRPIFSAFLYRIRAGSIRFERFTAVGITCFVAIRS